MLGTAAIVAQSEFIGLTGPSCAIAGIADTTGASLRGDTIPGTARPAPRSRVGPVRAAAADVAEGGEPGQLLLELGEAADVAHLALLVERAERLGADVLAAGGGDLAERRAGPGGVDHVPHHVAAVVGLADGGVGLVAVERIGHHAAPCRGPGLHRAVLEQVGVAVDAEPGHHDADLVVVGVVLLARAGRIAGHHDADQLGHVAAGLAPLLDRLVGEQRAGNRLAELALEEPQPLPGATCLRASAGSRPRCSRCCRAGS
jgi:hypothetical protein